MRISKSQPRNVGRRAVAIGLGIIYYLELLSCYYWLISPICSYRGMTFIMLPGWIWGVSVMLSLMPLLWMQLHFTRPSDFASWFLYLCLIFPSNIIVFMVSSLPPTESIRLLIVLNASFMLFEFVRRKGRLFAISHFKNSTILFRFFLPIIMITLSLIVFSYSNFQFNISFTDIYVRRLEARNILPSGSLARYLVTFLGSACVPIGIIYGLQKKKWHYIAIAFFAIAVIFSMKGSKGLFLSPVVFVTIYFLALRNVSVGLKLLGIFVLLVGLSLFEAFVVQSNILALYVVRRMLAVPAQLTTYYWEFFSQNPFVMMKDSIIGGFIPADANYLIPRARLIGFEYFGNIETNANANIWAAGYADFGYCGMAITSILAALTLKVIDSLGAKRNFVFASVCCAYIGLVWSEGAFYTSFLSNGVFMLIIALWLYPSQYSHRSEVPKLTKTHAVREFVGSLPA